MTAEPEKIKRGALLEVVQGVEIMTKPSNNLVQPGHFMLYAGAMFTGKTNNMINELYKISISNRYPLQVFKPSNDIRYKKHEIKSKSDISFPAEPVDPMHPERILSGLKSKTRVVAIDEMQFFDSSLEHVVRELLDRDLYVIGTALDNNFRGELFNELTGRLLAMAEVEKVYGVCMADKLCEYAGEFSQRLIDGKPAPYNDRLVVVEKVKGDKGKEPKEKYLLVCRKHFEIPGRPEYKFK